MATRNRTPQNDIHAEFQGLVTASNQEKLANVLASKLGKPASEARTLIRSTVARVGKGNGIVSKRSQPNIEQILSAVAELRPGFSALVEEVRGKITYRSSKTGKRDSSWIKNLLAGVPRLQEDGTYKMFKAVSLEEATAQCKSLGVDLPTEPEVVDADDDDDAE